MFHSAQHSNEVKPRDKLEGGDKEKIKAAVQETLDWLEENQLAEQATLEIDLFSRASATRARCLDHASRSCAWTTSVNSMGKFQLDGTPPAPRGVPQIEQPTTSMPTVSLT